MPQEHEHFNYNSFPEDNDGDWSVDSDEDWGFDLDDIDDSLFSIEEDNDEKHLQPEETFVLNFNLEDVSPELVFGDESIDSTDTAIEAQPQKTITFGEWLDLTEPDDSDLDEASLEGLPAAFSWAAKESERTTARFSEISADALGSVGGALGQMLSALGACGPLCLHSLGSLANATSSGMAVGSPGFGLSSPGFNIDGNGNFTLSGDMSSLSRLTGLSPEQLASGKYSAEDILSMFTMTFGQGTYAIFGVFSLVDALIDGLIPTPAAAA